MTSIEKEIKKKEKTNANVDRERAKLAQMVKGRNEIEERLNNTKTLDELKERINELNRQNEDDQAIWNAITFLCGFSLLFCEVSPLCVVVTSLCCLVSSLCVVVTSLRFVVSSLCLVMQS